MRVISGTAVQLGLAYAIQVTMAVNAVVFAIGDQVTEAGLTAGALTISLLPLLVKHVWGVRLPAPMLLLLVLFLFATLYLGEAHGVYRVFWWWDLALHTISGFLLGYVGLLMVHVMNGVPQTSQFMRASFVAVVTFLFSMTMGAFWEILEYVLDIFFTLKMQTDKSSGDACGLTDSMSDLTVNAVGALLLAVLVYRHLKTPERKSFIGRWTQKFVRLNPQLCGGSRD